MMKYLLYFLFLFQSSFVQAAINANGIITATDTRFSAPIADVRSFGGVADGSTDNLSAINNCFTSSANICYLSPGTWSISGTIVIPGSTSYSGMGKKLLLDNGAILKPSGNFNIVQLKDKSQIEGGIISTVGVSPFTAAMIYVQGEITGIEPGTVAENISLYGNNTNTIGTGDGIYLKADGANQYIAFAAFKNIRMFGMNHGIRISVSSGGGHNFANGNIFDNISIVNPAFGVYIDADLTNNNAAAENQFTNLHIQTLPTTTGGIYCNSSRNVFFPVIWDATGATYTVYLAATAYSNFIHSYPSELDGGAGVTDLGQDDNFLGRHYNGTIQIDSRLKTGGTLNLTNTVAGIGKSLSLQNYNTSSGIVGSAIYMGYNTITGGIPTGVRLVELSDPAHTKRGIFQLQTHNDIAGDDATTWINTLTSDYNGNVGIGTNVPGAQFDVEGTVSPIVFFGQGGGQNVGIGSLSPGQKLDVQGTIRTIGIIATGNVGIGTTVAPNPLYVVGTPMFTTGLNIGIGTASPTRLCISNNAVATCP